MVFHRLEIRFTNVVEIESKSVKGSVKTTGIVSRGAVRPGDSCGPCIDNYSDLKNHPNLLFIKLTPPVIMQL